MFLFWALLATAPYMTQYPQAEVTQVPVERIETIAPTTTRTVPFYSQLRDIDATAWRKNACGIASVAMVIEYYNPNTVSLNTLLERGISSGAYNKKFGWSHAGLIALAEEYGLTGERFDLRGSKTDSAFAKFSEELARGPVIASVHYNFDPKSTIPHLVVINRIEDDVIYYNDPAANGGNKEISIADFLKAWKKKFIVVRPIGGNEEGIRARV